MGNTFAINLILLTILLPFGNPVWGKPLEDERLFARHPNGPVYGLWISNQNNGPPPSLLDASCIWKNFKQAGSVTPFQLKEIATNLEIDNDTKSSARNEGKAHNLTFEREQMRPTNSAYRFHQIPFPETNLDPFLKIIPGLLLGQYQDDSLFKGAETPKEREIVKSFSVLLQLQFQF